MPIAIVRPVTLLSIPHLTRWRDLPKVGLAAQLPSGPNSARNLDYRTFWDFLSRKQQAFEDIPQERLEGLS